MFISSSHAHTIQISIHAVFEKKNSHTMASSCIAKYVNYYYQFFGDFLLLKGHYTESHIKHVNNVCIINYIILRACNLCTVAMASGDLSLLSNELSSNEVNTFYR